MRHFLVTLLIVTMAGCGSEQDQKTKEESQSFSTTKGAVEFDFPGGWYRNPKKHPFDLQCLSENRRMNTGVFVYPPEDLAEGSTPQKLFEHHIDDIRAKRKNFTLLKPEQTITLDDKRLTTVVYSGGRDSGKFCYRFTSIRFDDKPGMAIVVLQVALPSLWPDQESVLDGITKSARLRVKPPGKPGVEAE